MKNPLGVSPSKGYQGTTRGKEKILMTSVGIEPTTSGLDLPLLCRQHIYLTKKLIFISFQDLKGFLTSIAAVNTANGAAREKEIGEYF